MLNKSTIGLLVFALSAITIAFGEVRYFDSDVSECYEGSVTLTEDNIGLLKKDELGSCEYFGLVISKCPNTTYGCFVTSTRPSKAPAVGDTLTFGCGEHEPCDNQPGYNCCPYDNCNCNEVYECYDDEDDEDDEDDGGDNGAESTTMSN